MLTRLFVDNFKSFVNFEYRPDPIQLILGANGSGKSTLLDALLFLRQFVNRGDKADELRVLSQKTRWLAQPRMTFELEARVDCQNYVYRVQFEASGEPAQARVVSETVHLDRKPIFEFLEGEVRLYNDRFEPGVVYPFDPVRSALATITPQKDNHALVKFKTWFAGLVCFRLNPFAMRPVAEAEDLFPNVDLSNFAAWYRHLVQAAPRINADLLGSLHASLEGLSYLGLEAMGENRRLLSCQFDDGRTESTRFLFTELSEGQRCLICLYAILHFYVQQGSTVILDEPDNFLSLREIQPWLMSLIEAVEEGTGQVLLISHHPELMNQLAPQHGVLFVREPMGPTRLERFQGEPDSRLSPAELIARGWENG
ncbi:MAG: AAA family ATPase [Bryobacteraceae bacterium]